MKEKVYLDSTIPSYFFDQRESLQAFTKVTKRWWTEMAESYEIFISDAVIQELNSGTYPRKDEIIAFASRIQILPLATELEQVVDFTSLTASCLNLYLATQCILPMQVISTCNICSLGTVITWPMPTKGSISE